jgi:hypothetical protein
VFFTEEVRHTVVALRCGALSPACERTLEHDT